MIEARLDTFPRIQNHSLRLSDSLSPLRGRADILDLSPRQFEQLTFHYIQDVLDCKPAMTKMTRDGGYDLVCFDSEHGPFIVESKKYCRTRVGVTLVRQLAGVQLVNKVPLSFIVTTGELTRDALRERARLNSFTDYRMEVRDINDLLTWLGKKITVAEREPVYMDITAPLKSIGLSFSRRYTFTYDPTKKELQLYQDSW
jgi:hypothetical protein